MTGLLVVLAVMALQVTAAAGEGPICFEMRSPDGKAAGSSVRLDPGVSGTASLVSDDVAVEPLGRYRVEAGVRRIRGDRTYSIALEWLDSDRKHLSYENSWMGSLLGSDPDIHYFESTSPPGAAYARLLVEVPAPGALLLTKPTLIRLPPREAKLAIDLLAAEDSVVIRIENRREVVLAEVKAGLKLPEGMSSPDGLSIPAGSLALGHTFRKQIGLEGKPLRPDEPIVCDITASGGFRQTAQTLPFVAKAMPRACSSVDLPEPRLPEMDIRLGAYYFPVMLDWDRAGHGVRKVDGLEPLLGYYDETKPETADWHIWWALEHGISFFVFDWYHNQGLDYLNDALEKGFLKSRFAREMQFCIDWCNEGQASEFRPVDFSLQSLEGFIRTLSERYFGRPNYLKVDGKPVVLIHVPGRIVAAHGGWDGCRKALEAMRKVARSFGHPGVYFVAVHSNTPYIPDFQLGGFDCVTAYAYGFRDVAWDPATRSLPYESLVPRHEECFERAQIEAHKRSLDYIPSAWVGWDDAARSASRAVRTDGATPAAFRRMIEMLPAYVETDTRLALFESWNEWGEGGQAEPGEPYGFGRLSVIRDVLTRNRGPYSVPVPDEAEIRRLEYKGCYEDVNNSYYSSYSRKLGLERGLELEFGSPHDLWLRPASGLAMTGEIRGSMRLRSLTSDPVLLGPPMMGMRASDSVLEVRMRLTSGVKAQLFWKKDGAFTEERSVSFPVKPDGKFHVYRVNLGDNPKWRGVVNEVRFDPCDAPADITLDRFALKSN